ncbi:UDP-N-acetylmuramate dehydrogenase [Candidatus Peregrinibacteria bacterium]|nr:UDP-N-acetylmuramate dehydrogenase [Candidatus Peregrinibacteria bacterium]
MLKKLKERFSNLRENEPLKNHCTLRVGGPADMFYELTNIEELPELVTFAEESQIPYRIVGRGSNILFTDKGFRGLVIKNATTECAINGQEISADSGIILAQIVRLSVDNDLTGLEPLYGLPGTLGGAIWGNAGVPGTEICSFVKDVTVFNVSDGVRELTPKDFNFTYRHTSFQDSKDLILRATLELKKGDSKKSKELMAQINDIRRGKQPVGYSAGSFFKNPLPDKSAGYLIEQVGLKGYKIGDAEISPQHANFFLNTGKATVSQILELAKLAQQKVKEKFGIKLEMEVKIIGDL